MTPRSLLSVGIGLLLLGLLLILGTDNPATNASQQAVLVQGYLSNACATAGAGLVVVSGLASFLRPRRQEPVDPVIDHYS
jgi:hypothetical protein